MKLLELKDIGKIYVSENNVSVGIRGVNLSFNIGEFVAISGESGSGKSTLLNVISGMDSYEEGELYIEGETTSHYQEIDWEEYRQKYISFIFQNYNIIDSFTVLQNVELSLMHIDDSKERRKKALELIERVGLISHINHKGSKLSGGQKQRTVIARALAKDSPIILADEPTGNLDSKTSKEIIELLYEISKDKLLIVVTHNYEEVKDYATRHIRVFDGSIEYDHNIKNELNISNTDNKTTNDKESKVYKSKTIYNLKKGFTLGKTIFFSKPRLSLFLCTIMLIGLIGIFIITSLCGEGIYVFDKHYIFTPTEGRLVIAKQSGEVITEDELKELSNKYNAESYLHYDLLLDRKNYSEILYLDSTMIKYMSSANYVYNKDYGKNIIGKYPEKDNEIFLYLPISYQNEFGKDTIRIKSLLVERVLYNVVGIKYFYDNNLTEEILFTNGGFQTATAASFLNIESSSRAYVVNEIDGILNSKIGIVFSTYEVEENKIYVSGKHLYSPNKENAFVTLSSMYSINYYNSKSEYIYDKSYEYSYLTSNATFDTELFEKISGNPIIMHPSLVVEYADELLQRSYKQASLFFDSNEISDKEIEQIVLQMKNEGYLAVPSDYEYYLDAEDGMVEMILSVVLILAWVLGIVFLGFFINLCTNKSISAFKQDIAIMRSMGIQNKIIKISMYVRMLITFFPAMITMGVLIVLIYRSPNFNEYFMYLYYYHYLLIILGVLILIYRITRKQIKKMFNASVKKTLKGGAN